MTVSKILQAAASSSGGGAAGLDVDEVFDCHLYEGTAGSLYVTNGLDLSTQGGLVWIKERSDNTNYWLVDTDRGYNKYLSCNNTEAEVTDSNQLTQFTNNGYLLETGNKVNASGEEYVAWAFREATRFFKIVTWSGNNQATRVIDHGLGATPGMIIVKNRTQLTDWIVYHANQGTYNLRLNENTSSGSGNQTRGYIDTVNSGTFTVREGSQDERSVNENGAEYVAYVFGGVDSSQNFGPYGNQDIIKVGSYTGNNQQDGPTVNLGFEPQWVLIKNVAIGQPWSVFDNMRGVFIEGSGSSADKWLKLNENDSEANLQAIAFTPTGFKIQDSSGPVNSNTSSNGYAYVAIRRGSLSPPTSASDVFTVDQGDSTTTNPQYVSNFIVDMAFDKDTNSTGDNRLAARLLGQKAIYTNTSQATQLNTNFLFDYMNGWYDNANSQYWYSWMWKRAPKFFDAAYYIGSGSATTVPHNLEVAPEMMWIKKLEGGNWIVYHNYIGNDKYIVLNEALFPVSSSTYFNNTTPSTTTFTVGTNSLVNESGKDYLAFLFATRAGISKVGSYTGDGTTNGSNVVDCGFSNGAKFVLIKAEGNNSNDAHWYVFDSVRGISISSDPWIELDTTAAQQNVGVSVKPDNSGFRVVNTTTTGHATINKIGETYIFYAVAI